MSTKQSPKPVHLNSINLNVLKCFEDTSKVVSKSFQTREINNWIRNLSKINLLVGPNNSGKSRFLRSLFTSNDVYGDIKEIKTDDIAKEIDETIKYLSPYRRNGSMANSHVEHRISSLTQFKNAISNGHFQKQSLLDTDLHGMNTLALELSHMESQLGTVGARNFLRDFKPYQDKIFNQIERINSYTVLTKSSIYIPTLRSLRKFTHNNYLAEKTVKEYFQQHTLSFDLQKNEHPIVFDGTVIFEDLKRRLLTSSIERRKVIEYEEFLSKNFFQGKEVQLSPNEDETVHIKIGADKDIPIHNLGDGMQSILTLTYPAYFLGMPSRIHIEEPELYLHPGLQRRLIEVITENDIFGRHQWFMSTHSNHFLDLTLEFKEISIYRFQKAHEVFEIQHMSSPELVLLSDLGINASSVFRTNSIIWVEGITDRLYLKCYLQLYCKVKNIAFTPKEDIDYSIVEYGGNNVTHFNFTSSEQREKINVKYISERSFVLFDGDNSEKPARMALINSIPEGQRHTFDCKEIENTLSPEIIRKASIKLLSSSKKKNKEDLIVRISNSKELTAAKIKKMPLGKLLDKVIGENYFGAESGTIKDKVNFCKVAVESMLNDANTLSSHALSVGEMVYNFIKPPKT